MKKIVLKSILTAFVFTAFIACKEKGNDAMSGAAEEVAEASAEAVTYSVNVNESQITWKGEKPTGTHNGTVQLASGKLAVKEGNVEAGKFTIDMTTITDLDLEGESKENLEAHLKGTAEGKEGDFFNVNKYPTATFEMTGTTEKEGKTYVNGNLTIKDKTHAIEFPATISSDGTMVKLVSEPFVIDRTKWDVNFGSKSVFDNLGDKFINDEVEITISLVAAK